LLRKTKICFFTGYFPLLQGGAEYQTYLIANSLEPGKYDRFFISMHGGKEGVYAVDGYRIYNIKTIKILSRFGKHYFAYYPKIRRILSEEKPDIVYQRMGFSTTCILYYLAKKLNFRFIWACASDRDLSGFGLNGFRNILNDVDDLIKTYGISKAETILVQSNHQKRILKENFGRECYLVPNSQPKPENQTVKGEDPIKVLWISNIKRLKRPEIFIDLAGQFRDHPRVKFIMIGRAARGDWQRHLEERISGLVNLEYLGEKTIEEVNNILSGSHILVNTSEYEGFPNTFIQAWMRKVPVVSLNVDPDRILRNRKIGFHSGNFEQMALDLEKLIDDKNLREEMGSRAQDYAYERHTMKNIETIVKLIEESK
jgi:glycosyltransferase involved in cell wall biosynthesis